MRLPGSAAGELAIIIAVCLPSTGCGARGGASQPLRTPTTDSFPVTVLDDEGLSVNLQGEPQRLVTLDPAHAETVMALGLGSRLVGVPEGVGVDVAEAEEIESAADTMADQVKALTPDLVLAGPSDVAVKQRLRAAGIKVYATTSASFDDALADIRMIGRLIGAEEAADALAERLSTEAEASREAISDGQTVPCFLDLGDLRTVGPGSLEFDLLERAGCRPVTSSSSEPDPRWSPDLLLEDQPDVYLVSGSVTIEEVTEDPRLARLVAVREGHVEAVEHALISRPSPTMVRGIRALIEALGAA